MKLGFKKIHKNKVLIDEEEKEGVVEKGSDRPTIQKIFEKFDRENVRWFKRPEIKKKGIKDMQIQTPRDLFQFFLMSQFIRGNALFPGSDFLPNINVHGRKENIWWRFMEPEIRDFRKEMIEGLDIDQQVQNIIKHGAIIRKPWNGQTIVTIGCGHAFEHCMSGHHKGEYTVDPGCHMGADCMMLFGYCSLHKTIPEAQGKIKKIMLEGVIIHETDLFERDLLKLLEEGGTVHQEDGPPVIFKKNGKLFMNRYRWIYDEKGREFPVQIETAPYAPWTTTVTKQGIQVLSLGADTLGWRFQIEKIRDEHARGLWQHMERYTKTPFDPDFGIEPRELPKRKHEK